MPQLLLHVCPMLVLRLCSQLWLLRLMLLSICVVDVNCPVVVYVVDCVDDVVGVTVSVVYCAGHMCDVCMHVIVPVVTDIHIECVTASVCNVNTSGTSE